jgi:hypothetical protein
LNIPITTLGFLGALVFLKLKRRDRSLQQKLSEVDYGGKVLLIGSTTSLIIPITWGGVVYPWSDWHTLTPLTLGIGVFVFYESKVPKTPVLPIILFRNLSTTTAYFITFVLGIVNYLTYYLTLYFQAVQGYNPLLAGVTTLPQTLTLIPAAMVIGIAAMRIGEYRWALWAGWSLTVISSGLFILLVTLTTVVEWVFLSMMLSWKSREGDEDQQYSPFESQSGRSNRKSTSRCPTKPYTTPYLWMSLNFWPQCS